MMSAKKDIEDATKGIVASVNTNMNVDYHKQHIAYESEAISKLPIRIQTILTLHVNLHWSVINTKRDWQRFKWEGKL